MWLQATYATEEPQWIGTIPIDYADGWIRRCKISMYWSGWVLSHCWSRFDGPDYCSPSRSTLGPGYPDWTREWKKSRQQELQITAGPLIMKVACLLVIGFSWLYRWRDKKKQVGFFPDEPAFYERKENESTSTLIRTAWAVQIGGKI